MPDVSYYLGRPACFWIAVVSPREHEAPQGLASVPSLVDAGERLGVRCQLRGLPGLTVASGDLAGEAACRTGGGGQVRGVPAVP